MMEEKIEAAIREAVGTALTKIGLETLKKEEFFGTNQNTRATIEELEYLRWFKLNADLGPGQNAAHARMDDEYEYETGNAVPLCYRGSIFRDA